MRAMPMILPAAMIAELKQEQQRVQDALAICRKGTNCGMDMTAHEALLLAIQQRLANTILEFGGKGPKST